MSIFLNEIKKIFSWKTILLIVVINILLFKMLIEFDIKHFPNGRPFGDMFKIEQEIIQIYGSDVSEDEIKDFEQRYERKKTEANAFLENDSAAEALNIRTIEDVQDLDNSTDEQKAYHDMLYFEKGTDLVWEIQSYASYLELYKYREESTKSSFSWLSEPAKQVVQKRINEDKYSFYSDFTLKNFKTYITSVAVTIFISITLLLATLFIGDKRAVVIPLQYTSKKGRKLFGIKWLAGLTSAVLVTAVLTTIYMGLYSTNNTSSHFDLPLYAFDNVGYWYDLTFFQYIIIVISLMVFLSIILGGMVMAVSNIVPNRIALIVSIVVILFCMIAGGAYVVIGMLFQIMLPEFLIPIVVIVFVILTIGLTLFTWKREMKRDIV